MSPSARLHSPAAERNQGPLLAVLQQLLPPQGHALELASGTGQHAAHFAAGLPGWTWQPSDLDPAARESIGQWCQGLPSVRPALALDLLQAGQAPVPPASVDLLFCANLLHISPWACCPALMQAASRWLTADGRLVTYGPYRVDGEPLAPSNAAFDADLRARNPAWGLRQLADVVACAEAEGLTLQQRIDMPANNLCLVFVRAPSPA